MKRVLSKVSTGILGIALSGLVTLSANALPIGLLGGAAGHIFHFGGAASGLLHASKALGATSVLSKSATYSRGLTATHFASTNAYRATALAPRYSAQVFHTPGISQVNNLPRLPNQALPPVAPLPPKAFAPPGPYYHWDRWDRDAAWFVGGVFVGAAVTPLFIEQPVYYYPSYPGYYVVSAAPPADSSSSNTEQKKVEPTAN